MYFDQIYFLIQQNQLSLIKYICSHLPCFCYRRIFVIQPTPASFMAVLYIRYYGYLLYNSQRCQLYNASVLLLVLNLTYSPPPNHVRLPLYRGAALAAGSRYGESPYCVFPNYNLDHRTSVDQLKVSSNKEKL